MYEQVPAIDECLMDVNIAKSAIDKLDEIIEIEPKWWKPYLTELIIYQNWNLQTATREQDLSASTKVYEKWMKDNEMGISRNVAYADLLADLKRDEESNRYLEAAWEEFDKFQKKEPKNEDEENDFLFGIVAGIKLGYITETNMPVFLTDYHLSPDYIDFLSSFLED